MTMSDIVLQGKIVRLEPLALSHLDGLAAAATGDPELYRWSLVPRDKSSTRSYVETALRWQEEGTAVPFAIVGVTDGAIIGSTRFFQIEHWSWPPGHPHHGRHTPDVCEIGYTWLTRSAIRTGINTEAKFLMLTHAFEVWKLHRVCFHTDERNHRSRAAIERIGARFEGKLRAHRMAADFIPRDSMRYSIIAAEWPSVKQRLVKLMNRAAD